MRNGACNFDSVPKLARGVVVRIRDARWTVRQQVVYDSCSVLHVHGCDRSNRGQPAAFLLPFEPIEQLPSTDNLRVVSRRRWQALARGVLAAAVPRIDSLRSAASASFDIHAFQLEPALAIARGLASRVLIADEVGLGKTVQAGLIVAETIARIPDAHVLVVTPAGLRQQWHDELAQRFHLDPAILDAGSLGRHGAQAENPWAHQHLIITSIDYVKRPEVIRALEPLVWDLLVIDEAHGASGRSDRHAAADALAARARVVVMLTATPHSGDAAAFARLASIGDLDSQFPLALFRRKRVHVGLPSRRRTHWLAVAPSAAERQMHEALAAYARLVWKRALSPHARLAMIVLSRRAASSATSLARSVDRRLVLLSHNRPDEAQLILPFAALAEDDEPSADLAAPGLDKVEEERRYLEEIGALARLAAHGETKLHALGRLLRRAAEPAIVFTEYRDTLERLASELQHLRPGVLHGGLTNAERALVLRQFSEGDLQVLLATDTASEGLNLQQRCRLVVNLEVPWTPLRFEQRVGRVDRIGQARTVHHVQFVAAGTSEQLRVAAVVRRAAVAEETLASIAAAPPDERAIAAHVLGEEASPERSEPSVLPTGVARIDVTTLARDEAQRLHVARRLQQPAAAVSSRPFITAIRRRPAGELWALALEFTGADEEIVWDTLVGFYCERSGRHFQRAQDIRDAAVGARDLIQTEATHIAPAIACRLAEDLQAFFAVPMARERAIAAAAERAHARLAHLQRGLFDQRAERQAAAQRELLEQALLRCRQRTERLLHQQSITCAAARPVFALIEW